jgi:diguanylate cyclase
MHNAQTALRKLNALKQVTFRIATDNFGTGHSSLGVLQPLPIDLLKIDLCLIVGVGDGIAPSMLVRAVVALGRARGWTRWRRGSGHPSS